MLIYVHNDGLVAVSESVGRRNEHSSGRCPRVVGSVANTTKTSLRVTLDSHELFLWLKFGIQGGSDTVICWLYFMVGSSCPETPVLRGVISKAFGTVRGSSDHSAHVATLSVSDGLALVFQTGMSSPSLETLLSQPLVRMATPFTVFQCVPARLFLLSQM